MLRRIDYTVGADNITPFSPQFAGVQGENGATVLHFEAEQTVVDTIEALCARYDSILWRFEAIDGAGRKVTGDTREYSSFPLEMPLSAAYTEMGGRMSGALIISGVNNDEDNATELMSLPIRLYFRDFPVKTDFNERQDLNKAVLQVKRMREETYDIAAAALETKSEINETAAHFERLSSESLEQIKSAGEIAAANAETSALAAEEALRNAGTALTYSVQAAGYANDAKESSEAAAQSKSTCTLKANECASYAEQAAHNAQYSSEQVDRLIAFTGDINAILATVVAGE